MNSDELIAKLNTLGEGFSRGCSPLEPGDPLGWNTFTLKQGEQAVVNLISETVKDLDRDMKKCEGDMKGRKMFGPIVSPILQIFQKMEFIWQYFCGEFRIDCKDRYFREQFQKVWPEFIRGWYFGKIYVAYGEDFEEIDRLAFQKKKIPTLIMNLTALLGDFAYIQEKQKVLSIPFIHNKRASFSRTRWSREWFYAPAIVDIIEFTDGSYGRSGLTESRDSRNL